MRGSALVKASDDGGEGSDDKPKLPTEADKDDGSSKVTLSGLLNFIESLWSACGGERIIIFTTNHKEKLDPALIRRGRMDVHIEMSYCGFEAFKVLAKNYLGVEQHELFGDIRRLLKEADMSPADVAENLMPMSKRKKRDPDACLAGLVEALNMAMEEAQASKAAKEDEEAKAAKEKEEMKAREQATTNGEEEGKDKTTSEENKANGGI